MLSCTWVFPPKRSLWRRLCKSAPRVIGVVGEPGAAVHVRYYQDGYTLTGQGCSKACLYVVGNAIQDGLVARGGQSVVGAWVEYPSVSVN